MPNVPVIKFSHNYTKFPYDWDSPQTLLDVIPVKLESLGKEFIEYDTHYWNEEGDESHYPLPKKGDYMILFLAGQSGSLWTTIRSQKGRGGLDKLAYYRSLVGKEVKCVLEKKVV